MARVMPSKRPAFLPTLAMPGTIKPKMSNGTKNPKKLLKRALNVAKRRCGHSGRTNPQMMPATIAMTTLVSSPILIFFISNKCEICKNKQMSEKLKQIMYSFARLLLFLR